MATSKCYEPAPGFLVESESAGRWKDCLRVVNNEYVRTDFDVLVKKEVKKNPEKGRSIIILRPAHSC